VGTLRLQSRCIAIVAAFAAIAACSKPIADSPVRPERDAGAPRESATDASTDAGTVTIALPEEPWYRDKAEAYEDCVEPLANAPARHFPPPFELCDPRAEIINPRGSSAHFHYREFSQAHTTARRATSAGTCCYLIFEFPRHSP
jgi:hypothetical protein